MSFGNAVSTCLKKYADFTGRASRAEYWWFALFLWGIQVALYLFIRLTVQDFDFADLRNALIGLLLMVVVMLLLLLPSLAVAVRRLHDTGRSGAWIFVAVIPFVGALVLLVFLLSPGSPAPNQYGPPALAGVPEYAGAPPAP